MEEFLSRDTEQKRDTDFNINETPENSIAKGQQENNKKAWMSILVSTFIECVSPLLCNVYLTKCALPYKQMLRDFNI